MPVLAFAWGFCCCWVGGGGVDFFLKGAIFQIFFPKSNLNRAVCTFCLIFKWLYTQPIRCVFLYTHTNSCWSYPGLETFGTLSRHICAVCCRETRVIAACVSGWKKKSVSLSWSSQHSLLAQTQSCGKCSPVAFFLPFLRAERKQSFMKENSVPKYLLCALPNVTLNPRWDFATRM